MILYMNIEDNYISCIYHFFDKYLNPNYGNNSEIHKTNLQRLKLLNNFDIISFEYNEYINTDYPLTIEQIRVSEDYIYTSIFSKINENLQNDILNVIYCISGNYHAMCFFFEKNNDKINLIYVNSGYGTNHHKNYNGLYNLWYAVNFYDIYDDFCMLVYIVSIIGVEQILDEKEVYKYIKSIIIKYGQHKNIWKNIMEKHDSYIKIKMNIVNIIYMFLLNFADDDYKIDGTIYNNLIENWNKKQICVDEKCKTISKFFYSRYEFMYRNNILFTNLQISGSCTWYSIFWSIFYIKLKQNELFVWLDKLNDKFYNELKKYLFKHNDISNNYLLLCDLVYDTNFFKHSSIVPSNKLIKIKEETNYEYYPQQNKSYETVINNINNIMKTFYRETLVFMKEILKKMRETKYIFSQQIELDLKSKIIGDENNDKIQKKFYYLKSDINLNIGLLLHLNYAKVIKNQDMSNIYNFCDDIIKYEKLDFTRDEIMMINLVLNYNNFNSNVLTIFYTNFIKIESTVGFLMDGGSKNNDSIDISNNLSKKIIYNSLDAKRIKNDDIIELNSKFSNTKLDVLKYIYMTCLDRINYPDFVIIDLLPHILINTLHFENIDNDISYIIDKFDNEKVIDYFTKIKNMSNSFKHFTELYNEKEFENIIKQNKIMMTYEDPDTKLIYTFIDTPYFFNVFGLYTYTCYICDSEEYILQIIGKKTYNNNYDVTIRFEIYNNNVITERMSFNDHMMILSNDIHTYPFLLFAPTTSHNYILKKNNKYKLLVMSNMESRKLFSEYVENEIDIGIFDVSDNLLTLQLNKQNHNKLIKFYEIYGCNKNIYYLFKDLNKNKGYEFDRREYLSENIKIYDDQLNIIKNINDIIDKKEHKINMITDKLNNKYYNETIENILMMISDEKMYQEVNNIDISSIKNYELIKEKNINDFIKKHKICKYKEGEDNENNCEDKKKSNISKIYTAINKFTDELKNLLERINYDDFFIKILSDNLHIFVEIIQINTIINNLYKIIKILDKCIENYTCYEYAEIGQLLTIPEHVTKNNLKNLIEILCGFYMTQEQTNKIDEMINNYEKKDKYNVFHFMMGKGKSSVVTPFLITYLLINTKKNICLVVPEHLLGQSENTIFNYKQYIDIYDRLEIRTDNYIKSVILDVINNDRISANTIYIFDEIDMMFDPIQSNFNVIQSSTEWITIELYRKIYNYVVYDISDNIPKKILDDIEYAVTISKMGIKNVTYGMSRKNKNKRYVIPYLRKDTPLEGAVFDSIIITLVMTVIYFQQNQYILENDDLILLKNTFDIDFKNFIKFYDIIDNNYYCLSINRIYKNIPREEKIKIVKLYIEKYIIRDLYLSTQIKNCSFIDVMNLSDVWGIGYTGTINMDLPENSKFSKNIIADTDEILGVYFALTGLYPNSHNNIYQYKFNNDITKNIYNLIKDNDYNALIDVGAIFKDYMNDAIVKYIATFDKYEKKHFIYVDENDIKMEYYNNSFYEYNDKLYEKNEVFYYYSQKHIVGIDFKQPTILAGLVTITENNCYTEIAQGIYRLRKLNKGHIVDIAYVSNNEQITKIDLYKKIVNNDEQQLKSKRDFMLYQNLKYLVRQETKTYIENDLEQLSTRESYDIINIFNNRLFSGKKINITKEINDIYKYFEKNKNLLVKVLFGGTSIVKNIENENKIENKIENIFENNGNINFLKNIVFHETNIFKYYIYDVLKIEDIEKYTIHDEIDNIIIRWTINIFNKNNYNVKQIHELFIIVTNNNEYFLISPAEMLFYFDKYPIYTCLGKIINKDFFDSSDIETPDILYIFSNKKLDTHKYDIFVSIINKNILLSYLIIFLIKINFFTKINYNNINIKEGLIFKLDISYIQKIITNIGNNKRLILNKNNYNIIYKKYNILTAENISESILDLYYDINVDITQYGGNKYYYEKWKKYYLKI